VAAATSAVTVSRQLTGLEKATLYHYRFVATNALGTFTDSEGMSFTTSASAGAPEPTSCPNEASRQGPSAALPDCRAYEQVTPVNKGGAEDIFSSHESFGILLTDAQGYPSEGGERFLLTVKSALGEAGVAGQNAYLFSRGEHGWSTKSLAVPGLGVQSLTGIIFDPADFSRVGLSGLEGTNGEIAGEEKKEVQVVGPAGGPYETVDHVKLESEAGELAGGSADLSHVVLSSLNHKLAPGDEGQDQGTPALYESAGGQLSLLNADSEGKLISPCGALLGLGTEYGGAYRAVSSDGSKIFFTAPAPKEKRKAGCWGGVTEWGGNGNSSTVLVDPPQLYMRVNGTSTVDVSAPAPDAPEQTHYPAVYVGASANGERVFFLSKGELTADDAGIHDDELYEYNTVTGALTRVSRGDSGIAEGNVDQVPAISSDGSTVYFTAHSQLALGAPTAGGVGDETGSQANLYRYDTNTETTTYIATIGAGEYPVDVAGQWWVEYLKNGPPALENQANWYTTADGRYLAFASQTSLTGYDNTLAGGESGELFKKNNRACQPLKLSSKAGDACSEVYLYSVAAAERGEQAIVCASCDPSGAAPVGNAKFVLEELHFSAETAPRPVSEDGEYVFFDSEDALVPGALSGVQHVYEWHGGKISAISAPGAPRASLFLGSSASGGDVYFGTYSQLVAQDVDQASDLYDARIDGGFEGLASPACTGTGCQGVPGTPPIFATPASATITGVDDIEPPPPPAVVKKVTTKTVKCKKGFVKNNKGKCVKKKKSKKAKKAKRASNNGRTKS
jgi:hypothetical protein